MRSGAVTNRTYRAWGKIKLPKYLFKLHLVCGIFRANEHVAVQGEVPFIELTLKKVFS